MEKFHDKVVRIISQSIMIDWLEPYKNARASTSIGSGFFIDNKGTILTCSHLVINSKKIFIEIPSEGKEKYEASLISTCPDFDIAVLRVKKYKNKDFLKLLDSKEFDNIEIGSEVFAFGFPLGQDNLKITQGIISGRNNGLIQTSAALNRGNSGGPMLLNDVVIGINISKINNTNNIGYAVPITYFYNIRKQKETLIKRPILGIHYLNLDKSYINLHNIKCDSGVLIKKVHKNSPLWNCGLRKGHILCSLDNYNLDNQGLLDKKWFNEKMSINDIKNTFRLNQKIPISYYDNKKIHNKQFTFSDFDLTITKKYPHFDESASAYEVFGGMVVCQLNINHIKLLVNEECEEKFNLNYHTSQIVSLYSDREDNKLIITYLFPNTKVKLLENLRVGDIITKVNNIDVKTIEDYRKSIEKPLKNNKKRFIKITTSDDKNIVLDVGDILKEEVENSKIHKYKLSDLYKQIQSKKKSKKHSKKQSKKYSKKK